MLLPYNKFTALLKLILYTPEKMLYRFVLMASRHGMDPEKCSGAHTSGSSGKERPGRCIGGGKDSSGFSEKTGSGPGLSTTRDYHRHVPVDLMRELTICESFAGPDSPYAVALERPYSYGAMVGDFLARNGLLRENAVICEAGGGYGSLMHGLLSSRGDSIARIYMIDLSRSLLQKQRLLLSAWRERITSIQADIHEIMGAFSGVDLFIINEVLGDLNTLTAVDPASIPREVCELVDAYDLDIPDRPFNFNIGAVKLVETLCRSGIPAFLSEHSCDPIIPESMPFLAKGLELDAYPREIRLYRHSEYTIRFSHLERVARAHGRRVSSGPLIDLVGLKPSRRLETIFLTRACGTDAHEIIFELLDHIREYRWLTIT